MKPYTIVTVFTSFANRLKYKQLFFLVAFLFLLDLIVPDIIPMVDEIILGLLTLLLSGLRKKPPQSEDTVIEGEVIGRNNGQTGDEG
jgi:hypothetical protein